MPDNLARATTARPHNACDECRARKLKCSGEPTGCSRCITDGVPCLYSPRKQMGRPRNKRREQESQAAPADPWNFGGTSSDPNTPIAHTNMGTTMAYPGSSPQQFGLQGFASLDGRSHSANSSLDFGFGSMGMSYIEPTQSSPIPQALPPATSSVDYSQSYTSTQLYQSPPNWTTPSPDLHFTQMAPHMLQTPQPQPQTPIPPPYQLPTPPSTNFDISSPTSPLPCTCLPTLYKTMSIFPTSLSSPVFPQSMPPLKHALSVAASLLRCTSCGASYSTALQNSHGLVTLLHLLITTYATLLSHIEARAREVGTNKLVFRLGELQQLSATPELHTGTDDCPMGISVDFSGAEWRTLARKTIRKEIWGEGPESDLDHPAEKLALVHVIDCFFCICNRFEFDIRKTPMRFRR